LLFNAGRNEQVFSPKPKKNFGADPSRAVASSTQPGRVGGKKISGGAKYISSF